MEERSEPSLQKEDMIFLLLYFVVVCVIKFLFALYGIFHTIVCKQRVLLKG